MTTFRSCGRPVIHVRHVSDSTASPFHIESAGAAFVATLAPLSGESVLAKKAASGFMGTDLEVELTRRSASAVVLAGFTANECIDATARDANAAGLDVFVVGDATASFDLRGPDGRLLAAERVHALTLANLNAFVAEVVQTEEVVRTVGR